MATLDSDSHGPDLIVPKELEESGRELKRKRKAPDADSDHAIKKNRPTSSLLLGTYSALQRVRDVSDRNFNIDDDPEENDEEHENNEGDEGDDSDDSDDGEDESDEEGRPVLTFENLYEMVINSPTAKEWALLDGDDGKRLSAEVIAFLEGK
jgi:hypothetical protein